MPIPRIVIVKRRKRKADRQLRFQLDSSHEHPPRDMSEVGTAPAPESREERKSIPTAIILRLPGTAKIIRDTLPPVNNTG
eukprot:gene19008-biopygen5789